MQYISNIIALTDVSVFLPIKTSVGDFISTVPGLNFDMCMISTRIKIIYPSDSSTHFQFHIFAGPIFPYKKIILKVFMDCHNLQVFKNIIHVQKEFQKHYLNLQ